MTKLIELRLKPLDYYFFGTNETFDSGAKGIRNYSIKSNSLPQQTGLLGLLRHLFYNAGYKIGESFDPLQDKQDFGAISTISPLYLVNDMDETLVPDLYPTWESKEGNVPLYFQHKQEQAVYNSQLKETTFYADKYDPKWPRPDQWINLSTGKRAPATEIFVHETHIGIDKGKTMEQRAGEGAFYRQQYYRLRGVSFAFQATIPADTDLSLLSGLLPFGGEKKPFVINAREQGFSSWEMMLDQLAGLYKPVLPASSVLLLTDTFVADAVALEALLDYGVLQAKPFRNIRTPAGKFNFSGLGNNKDDKNQLYKSVSTTFLLKQGSLLFAKAGATSELTNLLKRPGFQQIGYNKYLVKS